MDCQVLPTKLLRRIFAPVQKRFVAPKGSHEDMRATGAIGRRAFQRSSASQSIRLTNEKRDRRHLQFRWVRQMRRDLWEVGFTALPRWTRPHCQSGSLLTMPDLPSVKKPNTPKKSRTIPDSEPDWTVERFVALMKCEIATCGEIVVVGGNRQAWMQEDYSITHSLGRAFLSAGSFVQRPTSFPFPKICRLSAQSN